MSAAPPSEGASPEAEAGLEAVRMAELEALFAAGRYPELLARLPGEAVLTLRQRTLQGTALLRLGEVQLAEEPLELAAEQGEPEARLEYGNWLRASGRFTEATRYFEEAMAGTDPGLRRRGQRWLGMTYHHQGENRRSVEVLEALRRELDLAGETVHAARVRHSLSVVYMASDDPLRALRHIDAASAVFRREGLLNLLLFTLRNRFSVCEALGRQEELLPLVEEIRALLPAEEGSQHVLYWVPKAMLYLHGLLSREEYVRTVDRVYQLSVRQQQHEVIVWAVQAKLQLLIGEGRDAQAMQLLLTLPRSEDGRERPELQVEHARLLARRGDLVAAERELRLAVAAFRARGEQGHVAYAEFRLAWVLHAAGNAPGALELLRASLAGMLRTRVPPGLRLEMTEVQELLQFASFEPGVLAYLEPVLDRLDLTLDRVSFRGVQVPWQVRTLGQVALVRALAPGQVTPDVTPIAPEVVAVLACLLLLPDQSRAELEERLGLRSPVVRRSLWRLRSMLGPEVLVRRRFRDVARYRLDPHPHVPVAFDLLRCREAIRDRDLPRALSLGAQLFLPGLDGAWVQEVRQALRAELLELLRGELVLAEIRGDWARAGLLRPSIASLELDAS